MDVDNKNMENEMNKFVKDIISEAISYLGDMSNLKELHQIYIDLTKIDRHVKYECMVTCGVRKLYNGELDLQFSRTTREYGKITQFIPNTNITINN